MPPGARISDAHVCLMMTPIPHLGGPIIGPGAPTVLIEKLPGSTLGDKCVCAPGPDVTAKSSGSVFYMGKAAVRLGDTTAHGGVIIGGAVTVLVGD